MQYLFTMMSKKLCSSEPPKKVPKLIDDDQPTKEIKSLTEQSDTGW